MIASTKKPTELLREEHQAVLEKLDALEGIIWVHFDKEEKALFPEFDNFMPRGSGPLAVMMDEYEVLRKTNVVMQDAIARYLNHDDSARVIQSIRQNGTHFIEFLRNHIFKEDNILFMMADMHLYQRQNEKVVKLFAEIEKPKK